MAADGHCAPLARTTRWLWVAALIAVMAAYAWASYAVRFLLFASMTDTWVHLALIRHTLEYGWFPGDAFYADMPTPPYYSLMHILLAAISALAGLAPHELWVIAPPLVAIATVAATFAWLRALTGDIRIGVIGAAVEMLVVAPYDAAWTVMLYPRGFALAPRALALLCYVRARQTAQLSWTIAAGIALGLCLATHLFMGGFCLLGIVFIELALAPAWWRPSRQFLTASALGVLAGSPWILNVFNCWRHRETLVNELFDVSAPLFQDAVWTLALGPLSLSGYRPGGIFYALPSSLWPLVALGLAFSLRRWWTGRATIADRYALLATAGTLLVLLSPLYGLLVRVGGVWTARVVQVIPMPLLVGLSVTGSAEWIRSHAPGWRAALAVSALAIGGALAWGAATTVTDVVHEWAKIQIYFARGGPLGNWELAREMARTGPLPRVVLSDPNTSYLLPYYLGCFVVAMPARHGSAYVDHAVRERAVQRVYGHSTPAKELRQILEAYQVDAVLLTPPAPFLGIGWMDPSITSEVLSRLRRHRSFVDTGCCGNLVLLRYEPEPAGAVAAPPDPHAQ